MLFVSKITTTFLVLILLKSLVGWNGVFIVYGRIFLHTVQFSHSVVSDCLWPHELQHTRPPCPSSTPRVYPNSCPLNQWCHPTILSSTTPFSSCPQSFPASGSCTQGPPISILCSHLLPSSFFRIRIHPISSPSVKFPLELMLSVGSYQVGGPAERAQPVVPALRGKALLLSHDVS